MKNGSHSHSVASQWLLWLLKQDPIKTCQLFRQHIFPIAINYWVCWEGNRDSKKTLILQLMMILRGHNSLYRAFEKGRGEQQQGRSTLHKHWGGGGGLMCDTCWGVTWAAWTGTLLYMCCPSAADAERCSTRMQCRPFERTPMQIADISRTKMASDTAITFSHWWISDGECYSSHLKRSHPDYLITVVEEVWEDIKDGRFRQDQFLNKRKKSSSLYFSGTVIHFEHNCFPFIYLQVFYAELVSIHVNSREEDGLHLVVS